MSNAPSPPRTPRSPRRRPRPPRPPRGRNRRGLTYCAGRSHHTSWLASTLRTSRPPPLGRRLSLVGLLCHHVRGGQPFHPISSCFRRRFGTYLAPAPPAPSRLDAPFPAPELCCCRCLIISPCR